MGLLDIITTLAKIMRIEAKNIVAFIISIFFWSSCSIKSSKNLVYDAGNNLKLDVYTPKKIKIPKDVIIFIHGGNWDAGRKSMYAFFGKGMARKGIVAVVIDYRLYPFTNFEGMAMDAAKAVKWVSENISRYGGDTSKIVISGHSAGGHLAALIATDNSYFETLHIKNPIYKIVLNDAFGLDMYSYLKKYGFGIDTSYAGIFTKDPKQWKKGSPIYYLKKSSPPILMYLGGKTYPKITEFSKTYYDELKKYQPDAKLKTVKGRHHVEMIAQFYLPYCKRYKEILEFISK